MGRLCNNCYELLSMKRTQMLHGEYSKHVISTEIHIRGVQVK